MIKLKSNALDIHQRDYPCVKRNKDGWDNYRRILSDLIAQGPQEVYFAGRNGYDIKIAPTKKIYIPKKLVEEERPG